MSHSVTIRTQTVTTNSGAVFVNTSYLRSWSGILKLLQLILGCVCVGILGHEFNTYSYRTTADLFFLLITTTFMIGTFIILASCLATLSTASIMSKTVYELLYHAIAFGLLLAASVTFIVHVNDHKRSREYEEQMAAAVAGLVNTTLYFLSTIIALRTYRGI